MTIKIFFSYTKADSPIIQQIANKLNQIGGIECWLFEQNSQYSMPISMDVARNIKTADYFFLFWSKNVQNRPSWVSREYDIALEREMCLHNHCRQDYFIHIIRLDDTALPQKFAGSRYTPLGKDFNNLITQLESKGKPNYCADCDDPPIQHNPLDWPVSKIMTSTVLKVGVGDTISVSHLIMSGGNVRHLIIVGENGYFQNIINHIDIKKRVPPPLQELINAGIKIDIAAYQAILNQLGHTKVTAILPHNPVVVSHDATIRDVICKLVDTHFIGDGWGRVSALPVLAEESDGQRCIGIVSYIDILCKLDELIPNISIDNLGPAPNQIMAINEKQNLSVVKLAMDSSGLRHMPIVNDNGELVGMFDDVMIHWLTHPLFSLADSPCGLHMREVTYFLTLGADMKTVVNHFFCADKTITALPVLEGKKLVGLISYVDILKAIKNHCDGEGC